MVVSSRSYFTARRAKTESKFVSKLKSAWKGWRNRKKKDSNTFEIRIQIVLCIDKSGNMLRNGFFKGNTQVPQIHEIQQKIPIPMRANGN